MFPINENDPYRKSDGNITTIGDAIGEGGGGGSIPIATPDTLGGVKIGESLRMDGETLNIRGYISPAYAFFNKRPIFRPTSNNKYQTVLAEIAIDFTPDSYTPKFVSAEYDINEVIPNYEYNYEFYNYVTPTLISDLGLVPLYIGATSSSNVTLEDGINNYEAVVLQGCYRGDGATSQYDTTIIYSDLEINDRVWFGVKDRNTSYSGYATIISDTEINLSASRTIKIWGIPKTI